MQLFEIDNPELFKKYTGQEELPDVLRAYWSALKKINRSVIKDSESSTLSRGNKYCVILFEELGFLNQNDQGKPLLEIEKSIDNGLLTSDFYLGGDYDMIIDIHGPMHYRHKSLVPMDSMLYIHRIIKKYHKNYLIIPYTFYDDIL